MGLKLIETSALAQRHGVYDGAKRTVDLSVCLLLAAVFALPMLMIALILRRTSKGSVLYRQTRIGRDERRFTLYKFRTMEADADRNGPLITAADDRRITRFGRFLRNTKLDELPQLLNVLRGEMSLVGPRPQVARFVEAFPPGLRDTILSVRPGLTGTTQLAFWNEEKILAGRSDSEGWYLTELLPLKCRLDAAYVEERSLIKDFYILYMTTCVVLRGTLRRLLRRESLPVSASLPGNLPGHNVK